MDNFTTIVAVVVAIGAIGISIWAFLEARRGLYRLDRKRARLVPLWPVWKNTPYIKHGDNPPQRWLHVDLEEWPEDRNVYHVSEFVACGMYIRDSESDPIIGYAYPKGKNFKQPTS